MTLKASTLLRLAAVAAGVVLGLTVTVVVHAARNSSGTYSLPSGNPVVSGTSITTTWANTTLSDLGTEITNSLDRTGKGTMLAPLKVVDGTVSAPAFTFTNEPGSGLYRIGSSNPAIAVSGAKRQEWTSAGTAVTGTLSCSGDATLSGNVTLNASGGDQSIVKSGNYSLFLGTEGGGNLGLRSGGVTRFMLDPSTGDLNAQGSTAYKITNLAGPTNAADAATKGYVDGAFAPLASPTFTGTVTVPTLTVSTAATVPTPTLAGHAATKAYVDGGGTTTTGTLGACQNGWNWGATARVWKVGRTAFVNVELAAPASYTLLPACQLPSGFFPAATTTFSAASASGSGTFTIDTSGLVSVISVVGGALNTTLRGSVVLLLP